MTVTSNQTIVLASGNRGKLEELRALLGPSFLVRSALEVGARLPEETGSTFEENAILKAREVFRQTHVTSIADDSGLEVDALNGRPGVFSARYAGEDADDDRNTAKLLEELAGVPVSLRTARFRSAIAIAFSIDDIVVTQGTCEGMIGPEKSGQGGFGYDPVFMLSDGRTMAELTSEEKNAVSHRGHAMRAAIDVLRERLTAGDNSLEAW